MANGKNCENRTWFERCSTYCLTVDLLNNQKFLRRPIDKIVLLVENDTVRFPTVETNKIQDDTITWGDPYVEVLRKRLLVKIKLWNVEAVYVTYCKFSMCECDLKIGHIHSLYVPWTGHVHSLYVTNLKIHLSL